MSDRDTFKTCSSCRYFDTMDKCLRYPPQYCKFVLDGAWQQPTVHHGGFCGEWKAVE